MKKVILFIIVIFLILVFSTPFLPERLIRLHSNVPIHTDDVFKKSGDFYYVYVSKLPVTIHRKFVYIDVFYSEPVIGTVQFTDGKFAITEKGHIIKTIEGSNKFKLMADMQSSQWDENFVSMFSAARITDILDEMEEFEVFNGLAGFYDKNKIAVIMGNGNYGEKFLEYKKILELYAKKTEEIKKIDMQYYAQAVIEWRKQ
jgi:hypothetical protein